MMSALFKPFDRYNFQESLCFISGEPSILNTTVFPSWMLSQFSLTGKPFKMLDDHIVNYEDLRVPVSAGTASAIADLDSRIESAFNTGYSAVKNLGELELFQWIAKQVYGIIHCEIRAGIIQQRSIGEEFSFSESIAHKFSNLHIMLQSMVRLIEFEGISPFSIKVFPVENSKDTFIYRDEINTLVFSLRMNDFGIIASLQDNTESLNYHQSILGKLEGKKLHPIQFEELCARFFYSAYLFNRLPEYTVIEANDTIYLDPMPLRISSRPVYDHWQVKTYGQVLENFWKPWNLILFEIIKNPERPISFLEDENGNLIPLEDIGLGLN